MKKKFLHICLLITLGLLLITPIGRVSANTEWNLLITNDSNVSINYTYSQLLAMPKTTVNSDLYCYGYIVTTGDWDGVSLSYLLEQVGMSSAVASVDFQAQDGYKVSVPLQDIMQPNVIIAYQLNGLSLPETLRLVLPEKNGNLWIAMITSITMSTATVQSGISGGLGIQSSINSTLGSIQTRVYVQPQPDVPKNVTIPQPVVSPTNVSQVPQNSFVAPESTAKLEDVPVDNVFVVALVVIVVASIASTLLFVRRRKIRIP